MPEALKPCPFCGCNGEVAGGGDTRSWWVDCVSDLCLAEGPAHFTEAEAIAAWNTRTTDHEIARLQDLVAKFQRGGVSTLFAEGETAPLA